MSGMGEMVSVRCFSGLTSLVSMRAQTGTYGPENGVVFPRDIIIPSPQAYRMREKRDMYPS